MNKRQNIHKEIVNSRKTNKKQFWPNKLKNKIKIGSA